MISNPRLPFGPTEWITGDGYVTCRCGSTNVMLASTKEPDRVFVKCLACRSESVFEKVGLKIIERRPEAKR